MIVKIIGFLSSIVLVRLVSKADYGTFSYAWNIYSIAMLLSGFGALYALLQLGCENADDEEARLKIYQYAWNRGIIANALIGIAIVGIGLLYPFDMKGVGPMLCMMGFLPLVQYGNEYQTMYLRTERKNREYSRLNILNVGLVFVFAVIGALFVGIGGFVISRYIAYLLLVLFGIRFWKLPIHFRRATLTRKERRDFGHISNVSMVNAGISQLLHLGSVFVLGIMVPDETVIASYKVATTIPTAMGFIPAAIVTYVFPYFAARRENGRWCLKYYGLLTAAAAVFNFVLSLGMIVFAEPVVRLMYGAEYLDSVLPFRILMVSYFFSGTFRTIAGNLLVSQRKLGFNTMVAVVSGIVTIIADVFFILRWQSAGAALATLLVVLLTSVLNTGYLLYVFASQKKKGESDASALS